MNQYPAKTIVLLSLALLLVPFHPLIANTDENFDYTRTVALILKADNGGHIFQRPERYDPQNAFVQSFAIVQKYVLQMQESHSGLALDMNSMQPQEFLLLVNHQDTQVLQLGDHWLSDQRSFAVMDTADYQTLKQIFDSRKRVSKPTQQAVQDEYIKEIHDLWQEDSEEFYRRYYFPERDNAITTLSSPQNSASHQTSSLSTQPLITVEDNTQPSTRDNLDITNTVDSANTMRSSTQALPIQEPENKNGKFFIIVLLLLIVVVFAGFWWWRKNKN